MGCRQARLGAHTGSVITAAVLHLFGRQFGVATADQLAALGVSPSALGRARRSGLVEPVMPQVVRLAGMPDSTTARRMALVLAGRDEGCLADVTAGELWGFRKMPPSKQTLLVPQRRTVQAPEWARVVRTSWPDESMVTMADGLRVTSPLRTLFMLASHFGPQRFEHAAEDAWHRGLVHPEEARAYLGAVRRQGRSGVRRFEHWLESVGERSRPSQSGLEVDLAHALERRGLPPAERQYRLELPDGVIIHVDLAWPPARLGVEPGHSWWHGGNERMRQDYERDLQCDLVGWRIVRFDEVQLRDVEWCARQVEQLYRIRLAQFCV